MPAARKVFFFLTCFPVCWTSDKVPARVVPSARIRNLLPDTMGGGLLRSVDNVTVCQHVAFVSPNAARNFSHFCKSYVTWIEQSDRYADIAHLSEIL